MCLKSKRTFPSSWQTRSELRIKCLENIWTSWTFPFCYASKLLLWSWPLLTSLTFLRTGSWKLEPRSAVSQLITLTSHVLSLSQLKINAFSHIPICWSFPWNQDSLISWKMFHIPHILHFTWLFRRPFLQKCIFFAPNHPNEVANHLENQRITKTHFFLDFFICSKINLPSILPENSLIVFLLVLPWHSLRLVALYYHKAHSSPPHSVLLLLDLPVNFCFAYLFLIHLFLTSLCAFLYLIFNLFWALF